MVEVQMSKEKYIEELNQKKERLSLYLKMEADMLTGSAQSYSLGSRSKSKFGMSLTELRTAINELEEEIGKLEDLISGKKSRRCVQIIPCI